MTRSERNQLRNRDDVKVKLSWRFTEFVDASGLSKTAVRSAIRGGSLRAKKIGRAVVIADEEARRFLGCEPVAAGGGMK
jgi:hypothetical protein